MAFDGCFQQLYIYNTLCLCPIEGLVPLDALLHHLATPAFLVPQALNLCGSVLFAVTLAKGNVNITGPVANGLCITGALCIRSTSCTASMPNCYRLFPAGVSLAANAVCDHLLGDRLSRPGSGIAGLALVLVGVSLCTLA
jgi:hypothetical protein